MKLGAQGPMSEHNGSPGLQADTGLASASAPGAGPSVPGRASLSLAGLARLTSCPAVDVAGAAAGLLAP